MSGPLPSNSERMRPIQFVSSSFFLSKTATTINFYKMQQPRNGQARITTNEQPVRKQKSKTNKQKSEFYKQQLKKKRAYASEFVHQTPIAQSRDLAEKRRGVLLTSIHVYATSMSPCMSLRLPESVAAGAVTAAEVLVGPSAAVRVGETVPARPRELFPVLLQVVFPSLRRVY